MFVSCINQKYTIDWTDVIRKLDCPGFEVTSQRGLALILTLYKKAVGVPLAPLAYNANTT